MTRQIFLQLVLSGLLFGAVYGLVAFGLTLIFALTRLLNFSHGPLILLAMYVCVALYDRYGLDPYLSILVAAPLLFVLGVIFYRFLFAGMIESHLIVVAQLTLALVFVIEGALELVFSAQPATISTPFLDSKIYLSELIIRVPLLVAFGVAMLLAVALYAMLQHTDFGRSIRACAQDKDAAALMGVDVPKVRLLGFALAIALLGIVGPLIAPMWVIEPHIGLEFTLFAFIVAVLGGLGSFFGAFAGGLIVGIAQSLGNFMLPGTLAPIVPYSLLVLILLFRPNGLIGREATG
jgi:branched-chain amino acid transport system permease protein